MDQPTPPTRSTPAQEWKAHWLMVLAAAIGFSFHSAPNFSLGLFMEPVAQEFGWERWQISVGMTMAAVSGVIFSPWIGALIDRFGSRRLAVPGLMVTSLAVAGIGLANGSFVQWVGIWLVYALVAMSIKSTVWTVAVSASFDAGRSMALAMVLCGTALAQIIAPPLSQWLIAEFGWRNAYMAIGFGWGGVALAMSCLFLFDARDRLRMAPDKPVPQASMRGLTVKQALRDRALIRIGVSTVLTMTLGLAILVHQVPILTATGITRQNAAYLASLGGLAGIAGKLCTGWLMDRFHAGRVGGITLGISAVAFVLLLEQFSSPVLAVIAMVVIGYASGCKLQICAYLTGRYSGMANYGAIFGIMASLIAVGAGLGPMLAGLSYDYLGGYAPIIYAAMIGTMIAAILLVGLGPQPDWNAPEWDGTERGGVPA